MAQTQTPQMDLDSILESELANQQPEEVVNSDTPTQTPENAPTPPAPGGTGEQTNGDTPKEEPAPEPETEPDETKGGQKQRPFTRLEKAEYSATKWKRRAKNLQKERDKIAAEFNRYKDLNPAVFRNPEERMQFMAWRASTAQRLDDMNADLQEIERDEAETTYEEKVNQCYSKPESAESFRQLDDHYSGAFEYACKQVDPDGIIIDFLRDSPYEPAMRNVIYKNGDLQEELFRTYRNPQIGNAKRHQILQRLEAQVAAFFQRQAQPKVKPQAPAQPAVQPTGQTRKYTLPPKKEVPPAPAPAPAPTPAPNPAPAPAAKPQVTGALTRGEGGAAGEPDESAQADALFKQLYGVRA